MKDKYENLDKIIFFILLVLTVATLPVLLAKAGVYNENIDKKIQMLLTKKSERPAGALDPDLIQGDQGGEAKPGRVLSSLTSQRDIFSKTVYKPNEQTAANKRKVLLVSEIDRKPLGIEYSGKVFFTENNEMLAQINVLKKSYMVREGSDFASYHVDELNENFIKLTDKNGQAIKIKYRQASYTNELVANIKELTSAYSEKVSKNGSFLEYKVLDIDEDSVLLSHQGQHLRLEKGMVHK